MAVEYVREMEKRGISIHDIARSINFGFNVGTVFFIEIAKLRAAREVWANIMKAFGANEADRGCPIHSRPAYFYRTIFDAGVNMLRNTTAMFSAVVGGVDTYENEPYDETVRKGMNSPAALPEMPTSSCRKNSACFVPLTLPAVPGHWNI